MQRRSALIEISASELRVAVVAHGRIVASGSINHWFPDWKDSWPHAPASLAKRLGALVTELGATGLPATVFYTGPGSAAGVFSCPASAGAAGAEAAARLALSDATESGVDLDPTIVARLAVDRVSRSADAEPPQIHTLAATDPEASVRAMIDLASGCGLSPGGVAPAEAVALAAAVRAALAAPQEPGASVVLRIAPWGCTLAVAAGGRLRLVRQISVGTSALVTALTGHIRAGDDLSGTVTLDRERAGSILTSAGIPARGQVFDAASGLAAESVLPLMQPILQRCIVEIKQSLRFGLTEAERTGARLIPAGPGSTLPNLVNLIAEQCGLVLSEPDAPIAGAPLSGGAIEDYASGVLRGVDLLLPGERTERRRLGGIRRGMWIGIGAACALATVDGVSAWFELGAVRAERDRRRAALADSSEVVDLGRTLGEQEAAISASRQRLAVWMGPRVRWDALLAVLAHDTPAPIRLSHIDMRFEGKQPECLLRGHAAEGPTGDATDTLRSFMERLSACPIVRQCQLGNARRLPDDQGASQEFEITIILVGLPAEPDLAMAPPAEEGR